MSDKSTPSTLDKVGGRKAAAFYASLASILLLALLGKATTEIMGLIDTLFLAYVGANVVAKAKAKAPKPEKKTEPQT